MSDIRKITEPTSGLSDDFRKSNYLKSTYKDKSGKTNPCYIMTRDGFTMLVMGYTGEKAMHFKEEYIKQFNAMEETIKLLISTRKDFPLLTENIKVIYDDPKFYVYSNECDMLNKLVIGKTAKQFRIEHDIEKWNSIRPYLSKEQIEMLDTLQKVDIGLLLSVPELSQRRVILESYIQRTKQIE